MPRKSIVSTILVMVGAAIASPAFAAPVVGLPLKVATTGDVIVTYLGSSAGYRDRVGLVGGPAVIFDNRTSTVGQTVNLGSFTAGAELTFSLMVRNTGLTFFSGPASGNIDGVAHTATTSSAGLPLIVGFEDLRDGGDKDYNDVLFSVSNAIATPEPLTWSLLIMGFGAIGTAMRRQRGRITYA